MTVRVDANELPGEAFDSAIRYFEEVGHELSEYAPEWWLDRWALSGAERSAEASVVQALEVLLQDPAVIERAWRELDAHLPARLPMGDMVAAAVLRAAFGATEINDPTAGQERQQ